MNFKFFNFQFLFFVLFTFLIFIKPVYSLDRPNNIYGIHLAQPDFRDIKAAAELVNSNGGDWGYITLVLQENDRDHNKWQSIFDYLRELHLIPIIRLATQPIGDVWRKPDVEGARAWANFLDSLTWVVKNRYVILFNEPNHASEWGGRVDPEDYGRLASEFAKELKNKNTDFFIILAGLDTAAPSSMPLYEDEEKFLRRLPKIIFDYIDGWASHSYPADYIALPTGRGRKSVRTYEWELGLLNNLGINKNLPVFITETGWEHNRLSADTVSSYLKTAYEEIWLKDNKIKAVTPFILNYQGRPFDSFSWRLPGEGDFYPQYYNIQSLAKSSADPEIIDQGVINFSLPKEIVVNSSYHFRINLKNAGQTIWSKDNGYYLTINSKDKYFFQNVNKIKPNKDNDLDFYFKTGQDIGEKELKISLFNKDKEIISKIWRFDVLPLPKLSFIIDLYPKSKINTDDLELQIFDAKEQLVYRKTNINIKSATGYVEGIRNVSFDNRYRVVILKPYYLPRQQYVVFSKGENKLRFELQYSIDFDMNGKFDWGDVWTLFKNPKLFNLFRP